MPERPSPTSSPTSPDVVRSFRQQLTVGEDVVDVTKWFPESVRHPAARACRPEPVVQSPVVASDRLRIPRPGSRCRRRTRAAGESDGDGDGERDVTLAQACCPRRAGCGPQRPCLGRRRVCLSLRTPKNADDDEGHGTVSRRDLPGQQEPARLNAWQSGLQRDGGARPSDSGVFRRKIGVPKSRIAAALARSRNTVTWATAFGHPSSGDNSGMGPRSGRIPRDQRPSQPPSRFSGPPHVVLLCNRRRHAVRMPECQSGHPPCGPREDSGASSPPS